MASLMVLKRETTSFKYDEIITNFSLHKLSSRLTSSTTMGAPLLISLLLFLLSITAHAEVPTAQRFTYTNEGEFGPYVTEYDSYYRALPIFTLPFQLCFYNTTPGAFYLALRMGPRRSYPESIHRWVWEANRGRPVGENATLSLLPDGNLILAEADGCIVWSTETSNRGVVGLKILPNGNIVLYDARHRFVWQSFEHPTDTLLVGQSLRAGGPAKLISRRSTLDGSFGIYSFVLAPEGLTLYINNISAKPLRYSGDIWSFSGKKIVSVKLECEPESEHGVAYELRFGLSDKLAGPPNFGSFTVVRPKYNATLLFLRLEVDGNLVAYTYYASVLERIFTFFSDEIGWEATCALPSKCGGLGVCKDEMCVACPTPKGLLGWDEGCRLPEMPACGGRKVAVDYYKVVGVENFISSYAKGEKGVKVEECKKRCGLDCKCVGFMYREMESKCWLAPMMGTLAKVSNSSHVAYIKL